MKDLKRCRNRAAATKVTKAINTIVILTPAAIREIRMKKFRSTQADTNITGSKFKLTMLTNVSEPLGSVTRRITTSRADSWNVAKKELLDRKKANLAPNKVNLRVCSS